VKVDSGASILDAAQAAGVRIPTLCHDDGLHPYGACRICMVEVEGPPRRMLPACTTPAAEAMVVHTMTPAVVQSRKDILELLLINHPLDCPVCDKAGECRLQDLVHVYGLGPGAFAEEKRTTPPDYDSPVIERNQNRCILCGKCVRVCSERCGVGALTFALRGGRSRITPAFGGPADCEFCGECVEICPVGALTSKQFKHKARSWNLERTASTCIYCGCGCPITVETHRGRTVRVRTAGGHYLCAKGRFGWDAVHHEARLAGPKMRVEGRLVDCTWDEALAVVAANLKIIKNRRGADSIGGLGSVRTTNEENYLFQKFMRTVVGTNNVDLIARLKLPYGLNTAYFPEELASMGKHRVILLLDGNAGEINPLAGIEIVRAVNKRGSRLILTGSGQSKFAGIASVVIPQDRDETLAGLTSALRSTRKVVSTRTRQAVDLLAAAESVAVVLPARLSPGTFALIQELAGLLKSVTCYPLVMRGNVQGALDMGMMPDYYPGYQRVGTETSALFSNAWNAALPETPGLNAVEMVNSATTGKLSAIYVMGDDPVGSDPGLAGVLKGLDFLVVQDIFLTETARLAHVVLPATSFLEKTGTITTIERRLRPLAKVEEPLGESKPDWEIIQALSRRMGAAVHYSSAAEIMSEIRIHVPMYRDLPVGACWQPERSPLSGTIADLSLSSDFIMRQEVITSGRLLFSSGTMTTRSKELRSIAFRKAEMPEKAGS
jgi:formate dehydrogenase alpha subunit